MKTEHEIAKENIKIHLSFENDGEIEFVTKCSEHKATLQRWLEFLEKMDNNLFDNNSEFDLYKELKDKITDINKALEEYEKNGI